MTETFAALGIPFPLFEGLVDDSSEYAGKATCSMCGKRDQHCFDIGIGSAIMVDCPNCKAVNGLDADDREDGVCRQCEEEIQFPDLSDEEIRVCYSCLREGKAAITKDSKLGMISWEQALEGVTHGTPNLTRSDFDLVPGENGWTGAKLASSVMFELLRTPGYSTWQDISWQFCCSQPMIFVGTWNREDFSRRAPDGDGKAFFEQVVQKTIPGLWEDELHDVTGVYAFRCASCNRLTAHWDIA